MTTHPGTMANMDAAILSAMRDAELKAWEGLRGYKFWMFGYHAARWVNYNQLLPSQRRFRSPFKSLVEIADRKIDTLQSELPLFEVDGNRLLPLGFEGDGA
jgi:hypothetical protein